MHELPKVSVVTICYNAQELINHTLQSVSSQQYPALEYIVIDGASTDNTMSIISNYKSKITHLLSEPDSGLYDAMNKGLGLASGDFVIFMNAGDTFYNTDTVRKVMEKGKNADFVYGRPLVMAQDGTQKEWHKMIPTDASIRPESFLLGMVVCHQAIFVRRSIAPNFDLRWKISSDIDWTIKVLKKSKAVYFYHSHVCLYLAGGLSNKRKWQAVYERFRIGINHFGFSQALFSQLQILASWFK